jgi:sterol desaturase/sphingolipid hydroxylase (fatty acid hydroxylase superfamily)
MHPFGHILYFSTPLVFLLIPASPFVVAFTGIYLMLSPAPSHSGFHRLVLGGDTGVHNGDYFHNLHHRYFECNYGMLLVPIDKWLGTFHDGSPEAHQTMKERHRATARV